MRWLQPIAQKHGHEELPLAKGWGSDQERQAAMAQERPRGATSRPRPGAVAKRSYPTVQGAAGAQANRSYSTFKVRRGSHEEILLIQGKEQRLHFA